MKQIKCSHRCRKCDKIFKIWKHATDMKKTCDELVIHSFPGGKYDKSKSIFDKVEQLYYDIITKEKTYI